MMVFVCEILWLAFQDLLIIYVHLIQVIKSLQISIGCLNQNNVGGIVRDWAVDLIVVDVPIGYNVIGFPSGCPSWNVEREDYYWRIPLMLGKALLQNDSCIVFFSSSLLHDKKTRIAIKRFTERSEFNNQIKQWVCINTLAFVTDTWKIRITKQKPILWSSIYAFNVYT